MFSNNLLQPSETRRSIPEITDMFQSGALSPMELTQDCLNKISVHDEKLNAFCLVTAESALAAARESEKRWRNGTPLSPLDGIPATIKDLFEVKGQVMRQGSYLMPDRPAKADSPVVKNLRKAGAVFLGATATPEFGHKGVTDSPLTGITRNPWNTKKTPGGSSGGSAVAAAMDMGMIHLGSDAGGSCRIPASFTGVFGYKPTQNALPIFPATFFYSFSTPGLLAARIDDITSCLPILRKRDARDPTQVTSAFKKTKGHKKTLKAAYIPSFADIYVHPETAKAVKKTAQQLQDIAAVEEIMPQLEKLVELTNINWLAGASTIIEHFPDQKSLAKMDPSMRLFGEMGQNMPLSRFLHARQLQLELRQYCAKLFKQYDFLVMPTTPTPAFQAGVQSPRHPETGDIWYDWTPFTFLANMAGLPAISVPAGFSADGLPLAVQIIGAPMDDISVLDIGAWLEQAMPPVYPV
ncbi:MAG: amidase [Alphaproteobacteria bacterium]|nr:MAG: amidase [Alphaproteobacteria bacterium]